MPSLFFPEIILYSYIALLMAGIAVLGFFAQRQANLISNLKNQITSLIADLGKSRQHEAYLSRRLAEQTSENSAEGLIEKIAEIVIGVDRNRNITLYNPYAEKLLGYPKIDVIMRPFPDFFRITDKDGSDLGSGLLSECFTGNIVSLPPFSRLEPKNSTPVPVTGNMLLTKAGDGETGHAVLFLHPLKKETAANDELTAAISNLRTENTRLTTELTHQKHLNSIAAEMIAKMNYGLITLTGDRRIFSLNPQAEEFLGKYEAEIKGKEFTKELTITDKNDQDRTPELFGASGQTLRPLKKWLFLTSKNGKTAITGVVIPLSFNELPGGLVFAFRDAQNEYEEESEEKGFISGAAHDLRAPLTTIRGVLELLSDNYEKLNRDEAKEIINGAKDSALHLISLVNDLLNVSRLDQGKISISKTSFSLVRCAQEVTDSFAQSAKDKKLYLTVETENPPIPNVCGDSMKVNEIIMNLVSNAVKYTIRGGVTVKIRADESAAYVRVTDTGPGISRENQSLLFKKFQQVGAARLESHTKSTGLGLYIARKFARLMNGDIYLVESEPEKGSTFELKLPFAPEA